jgi:membrane-bound lytic murein transglycosylase A
MTSCGWLGCRKKPDYYKTLPPGQNALIKLTDPKDYPDFGTGFKNRDGLAEAVNHSLKYYQAPSAKKYFPYNVPNDQGISFDRAVATLEAFKKVLGEAKDASDLHRLVCERFDVYMSRGCDEKGTVLFTGYCTPIFKGSLQSSPDYKCPLYKLPPDLAKVLEDGKPLGRRLESGEIVPYYTRKEIETRQLLAGKGLELVWLRDPLEVYIAHVQGSARIILPDNKEFNVGYAGKTDHEYTSLGLSLVADKKIAMEDLSLQEIIKYFEKHPHELKPYTYKNELYVFFTQRDGGPYGCLNAPVTPYRTVATDKTIFPRGLLAYVVTKTPKMQAKDKVSLEPFYSFVLDQDAGIAIRAAGRSDIYMGVGPEALLLAGRTRSEGKLYYLAVK